MKAIPRLSGYSLLHPNLLKSLNSCSRVYWLACETALLRATSYASYRLVGWLSKRCLLLTTFDEFRTTLYRTAASTCRVQLAHRIAVIKAAGRRFSLMKKFGSLNAIEDRKKLLSRITAGWDANLSPHLCGLCFDHMALMIMNVYVRHTNRSLALEGPTNLIFNAPTFSTTDAPYFLTHAATIQRGNSHTFDSLRVYPNNLNAGPQTAA